MVLHVHFYLKLQGSFGSRIVLHVHFNLINFSDLLIGCIFRPTLCVLRRCVFQPDFDWLIIHWYILSRYSILESLPNSGEGFFASLHLRLLLSSLGHRLKTGISDVTSVRPKQSRFRKKQHVYYKVVVQNMEKKKTDNYSEEYYSLFIILDDASECPSMLSLVEIHKVAQACKSQTIKVLRT